MTRHPKRKKGFSLIELMVSISIVAILIALGFVGFKAIRRSQDQRTTRATLEIARSLFNAFIKSGQSGTNSLTVDKEGQATQFYLKLAPGQWWFNDVTYNALPSANKPVIVDFIKLRDLNSTVAEKSYARSIDYYNVPLRDPKFAPPQGIPVPMNAPRNISNEPILNTYASVNEQDLYNDWLPAEPPVTNPGSASDQFSDRWPLRNTMLMIRRMRSAPEAKAIWSSLHETQIKHLSYVDSAIKTDVGQDFILDSWGQPILYVPGSGLRGLQYGEGPRPASGDPRKGEVKPTSGVTPDLQAFRSPDGRGFWMSAGPDGFYDTQDDNLYSFDN